MRTPYGAGEAASPDITCSPSSVSTFPRVQKFDPQGHFLASYGSLGLGEGQFMGAAIGATGDYLERMAELVRAKVDVIVIDTAHGHSSRVLDAVKEAKRRFPEMGLIAGNIATEEAARDLIKAGAAQTHRPGALPVRHIRNASLN